MAAAPIRPLLSGVTTAQSSAILGAMRAVAETGSPLTHADRTALQSTNQYMLGHEIPVDIDGLSTPTPAELATTLRDTPFVQDSVRFMTVMAFIDASLPSATVAQATATSWC